MRADPLQIERAKGADLVALVSQRVKLARRGRALWGLCPFHREKTPSFKVEDGRFHCFGCGASGDVIEWVKVSDGLSFGDAVVRLSGLGVQRQKHASRTPENSGVSATGKIRKARAIWSAARPIDGTHAEAYLRARRIEHPDNPSLRFIPAFPYTRDVILPAMVAAMLSSASEIVAVQVTALNPQTLRKASVAAPRKTFGCMADGAVRLARAGDILGLAEGTETGLAAMQLSGVPIWCCLGAQRMHAIAIPEHVRELHIFADDDAPGREAAERTVRAHRHRRVQVRFPPPPNGDWNDCLGAT